DPVDLVDRAAEAATHALDALHPAAAVAIALARLEREELAVVAAERDRREPEKQRPEPGQKQSSNPVAVGRKRTVRPRSSSSLACLRSRAATTIRPTPATNAAPPTTPLTTAIRL